MRISDWSSDVCSSDLIGALQARVAKGGGFGVRRIARKPTARVGVGEELRQMLVEFGIHRDDRGDRRFQDLLAIRGHRQRRELRSEEHTSALQSLMRISYAVLCFNKQN